MKKAQETETKPIESFEEACAVKGLDPAAILPDVSGFPEAHQKAVTAFAKLIVIGQALNEDWKPDWNTYAETKWYPWFDLEKDEEDNPSGFRFGVSTFVCDYTYAAGGSRLCFATQELSDYAAKQFLDLYEAFIA